MNTEPKPLTAAERVQLDRLLFLWATRRATKRQILRCQQLELRRGHQ